MEMFAVIVLSKAQGYIKEAWTAKTRWFIGNSLIISILTILPRRKHL